MRAFRASSSSLSPSWKSMARLALPSRLELKRPEGSFREAPLAKVIFTTFLYVSPVQISPSCDQTGVPLHFHSSATSGSASLIRARSRESISPLQSPRSSILSSISSDGDSAFFDRLFFMLPASPSEGHGARESRSVGASPAAPLGGIRQHEQVQTGEQQQGEREQRRVRHPGRRRPSPLCNDDEVGDDGHRKGNGQPAVGLPNPFVPVHWDLQADRAHVQVLRSRL